MHGRRLLAALLLAAASGCAAPEAPVAPPPPGPAGGCNAPAAQFAVGQAYGEAMADEVRRRSGARTSRALRPGQAVTLEYSSDRINFELDAGGRIVRVRCG